MAGFSGTEKQHDSRAEAYLRFANENLDKAERAKSLKRRRTLLKSAEENISTAYNEDFWGGAHRSRIGSTWNRLKNLSKQLSFPLDGLGRVKSHKKTKAISKRLHKYVDPCMKRYDNPAYCWRVAWNIYCAHVDPKYPGCTKYGKKWGKPYSKKLSRRVSARKRKYR